MSETAIAVALVSALLTSAFVLWIGRTNKTMLTNVRSFVAANTPSDRLASAQVVNGAPIVLDAIAGNGTHGLWLDMDVYYGQHGRWSADVSVEWRAGHQSGKDAFAIGYDGDGHVSSPRVRGVIFVPAPDHTSSGDRGLMHLLDLPGVPVGAPIGVRCTITLASPAEAKSMVAFVGLSNAGSGGGQSPATPFR